MLDIRPAGQEDLGAIKVLLAVCLLPTQEIDGGKCAYFVAESERGIIGVCGVELCSTGIALLSSLGVMPGYRKQQIGRRLIRRAMSYAEDQGIDQLFLFTESAKSYFLNSGFTALDRKLIPNEFKTSRPLTQNNPALLMARSLRPVHAGVQTPAEPQAGDRAQANFDGGFHCAESVLMAAADHAGIQSPLIPAIATGFCHGTSHTWGTCGALSGAIMAINLTHGRSAPDQSTGNNYLAVRKLIDEFGKACGSTLCRELMACDLDTRDGRNAYQNNHQRGQCREFVGIAANLAAQLIDAHRSKQAATEGKSAVA